MTARLTVKVVPGATQSRIVGRLGEALKIRVQAPPEKGKANTAVLALLADFLGVPASHLSIVSGQSAPTKVIRVEGMSTPDLEARVEAGC